jgi:chromosome segregation ATPase
MNKQDSKGLNVSHISQYKKEINQLKSEIDFLDEQLNIYETMKQGWMLDLVENKQEIIELREKLSDLKFNNLMWSVIAFLEAIIIIIFLFK